MEDKNCKKTNKNAKNKAEIDKFKNKYFAFYDDVKHYSKGHEDW